jgi:hypothetical protein
MVTLLSTSFAGLATLLAAGVGLAALGIGRFAEALLFGLSGRDLRSMRRHDGTVGVSWLPSNDDRGFESPILPS